MATLSALAFRRRALALAPPILLFASTSLSAQWPTPLSMAPGGATASPSSPWTGVECPAAITVQRPFVLTSYTPLHSGIKGLSHGAFFVTTSVDSVPLLAGVSALSFGPLIDARLRLSTSHPISSTMAAGASLSVRVLAVAGYPSVFLPQLDLGFKLAPVPWMIVEGTATNATGTAALGTQPEQGIRLSLAADLDTALRLAVDVHHELRRPTTLGFGIAWEAHRAAEVRFGLGLYPIGVSAGISLWTSPITVDAAISFVAPLGVSTSVGVAVPLQGAGFDSSDDGEDPEDQQ